MKYRVPRRFRLLAASIALLGLMPSGASAMHIAEGMLPKAWAFGWMAVCVPFVVSGFFSIKKKVDLNPKAKVLLAMCGAFAFVLSALKIPSVTGSCSHPTGVGLGAILFGHFDPEDADCEAAAAQSKVPILFVHGDADGFVPYDMGKRNYEACRAKGKKFLTVHGAEHAVSYYHDNDAYTKQATEFLQDCLARRGFVWPPETDEPEK